MTDESTLLFLARQRLGLDDLSEFYVVREPERYGYVVTVGDEARVFVSDAEIRQHDAPQNPVTMPVSGPTVDGTKVTRDTAER